MTRKRKTTRRDDYARSLRAEMREKRWKGNVRDLVVAYHEHGPTSDQTRDLISAMAQAIEDDDNRIEKERA